MDAYGPAVLLPGIPGRQQLDHPQAFRFDFCTDASHSDGLRQGAVFFDHETEDGFSLNAELPGFFRILDLFVDRFQEFLLTAGFLKLGIFLFAFHQVRKDFLYFDTLLHVLSGGRFDVNVLVIGREQFFVRTYEFLEILFGRLPQQ